MRSRLRSTLLSVELVLYGAILALSCATNRGTQLTEIQAVVIGSESLRTLRGDFRYFLTLEFRGADDALHHERVEVGIRDWLMFGREGADVCLTRWGTEWKMGACR